MFGADKRKKEEARAAERTAALDRIARALRPEIADDVGDVGDAYTHLQMCRASLAREREILESGKTRQLEEKRFWTAMGMSSPLAIGLLFLEPFSGTIAMASTVVTGLTPTVIFKRMLDDAGYGEKPATQSIAPYADMFAALDTALTAKMDALEKDHPAALRQSPAYTNLLEKDPLLSMRLADAFDAAAERKKQSENSQRKKPAPRRDSWRP